jgi:hypothetical protein
VPPHEFVFELALPDQPDSKAIVAELAAAVLGYVGYAPDAIADVAAKIGDAVAGAAARGRHGCHVAFRAHGGELQIAVTSDGAAAWHTARPLP